MNLKRSRTLLSASVLMLVGVGTLVGGTYALFTDTAKVTNHLKAGNLNISLVRTKLVKNTLNNEGVITSSTNTTEVDFSGESQENIFGLDTDEVIVPTSSFTADLKLINGKKDGDSYVPSSVAFSYSVKIVVSDDSNGDLINQLSITVKKDASDTGTTKTLKEFDGLVILEGNMTKTDTSKAFSVAITFVDTAPDNAENNKAQDKNASFDLVVEAVQLTSLD